MKDERRMSRKFTFGAEFPSNRDTCARRKMFTIGDEFPPTLVAMGMTSQRTGDEGLVEEAVARAKAGETEGLHFLYVRFAPDVQRYVDSFVHDHHEAEDITQNVFAKLMTKIDRYEQREVPFVAWILRVARNAALDHLRTRRAIPTEDVRVTDSG